MYYPLAKQGRFGELAKLCTATGIQRSDLDFYVANAEIERSDLIVCDRIVLGDPANKVCAVLQRDQNGVTLWAGFIDEASEDRQAVEAFVAKAQPAFSVTMAIGEFEPRTKGRA